VHADFDGEYDWLIQVDIHRDTRDIPHSRGSTAASGTTDDLETPTNLTDRTMRRTYGSLTRLDQTQALVRLQPGWCKVNSAQTSFWEQAVHRFQLFEIAVNLPQALTARIGGFWAIFRCQILLIAHQSPIHRLIISGLFTDMDAI